MLGRWRAPRQRHAEVPRCTTRPGCGSRERPGPFPAASATCKIPPPGHANHSELLQVFRPGPGGTARQQQSPALPCRRPAGSAAACLAPAANASLLTHLTGRAQWQSSRGWSSAVGESPRQNGRAQPGVGVGEARFGEKGNQKRVPCCSRRAAHGRCVYISFGSVRSASIEGRCWYIGKAASCVVRLEGGAAGQRGAAGRVRGGRCA